MNESETKTAQLIGIQPWMFNLAHVYRLSHQVTVDEVTTDHVIVSVSFSPPEAMAFACDAEANLLPDRDSRTQAGYAPGSMSHEDAITQGMGYELLPPAEPLREFPNEGLPPEPKTEEEWRAFAEEWNATLERNRVAMQESLSGLRETLAKIRPEAPR